MNTCPRCGRRHADLKLCDRCDESYCPDCRVSYIDVLDTWLCADCMADVRQGFERSYGLEVSSIAQHLAFMIEAGEVKAVAA